MHPIAVCRWCGGRFQRVHEIQWLCETPECAERQIEHAITRKDGLGPSPYLYLPTPAGVELHEAKTPNALFGGAAGGSKSHSLRWDLYAWCLKIPNYQALILRRTYPELEETHLLAMEREAEELSSIMPCEYAGGQQRRMRFENGSFIKAGHCESKSDMKKMLSREYDDIRFDEGTTFETEPIQEISSRARSSKPLVESRGGAFVRVGSNPGGPSHLYLLDHYILRAPDPEEYPRYNPAHYSFIPARVSDNPYLSPRYTEERLDNLTDSRRKQLADGDWSVFGSQFLPSWEPSKHVLDLTA